MKVFKRTTSRRTIPVQNQKNKTKKNMDFTYGGINEKSSFT